MDDEVEHLHLEPFHLILVVDELDEDDTTAIYLERMYGILDEVVGDDTAELVLDDVEVLIDDVGHLLEVLLVVADDEDDEEVQTDDVDDAECLY